MENNENIEKILKDLGIDKLEYDFSNGNDVIKYAMEKGYKELTNPKVYFVNESDNPDPEYKSDEASGFDIRSNEDSIIPSMSGKKIRTGLYFDIPKGFELEARSRSGLADSNFVFVLNSPGTIDSDYIGELKIILFNLGNQPFVIKKGDRIAQLVISAVYRKYVNLEKTNKITKKTERGNKGFGSTGLK